MNIKNFLNSNNRVSKIIGALGIALLVLVIFQAGFFVGFHNNSFRDRWDNRYSKDLNDPRSPFAPFMMGKNEIINPHGAFGQIITKNLPRIMVQGPNRAEEVVLIKDKTVIRKFKNLASTSDLIVGDEIIAIGEPNDNGEIEASLIRIMPHITATTSMMRGGNFIR